MSYFLCPNCRMLTAERSDGFMLAAGLMGAVFSLVGGAAYPDREGIAWSKHLKALPALCFACARRCFQPAWEPLEPAGLALAVLAGRKAERRLGGRSRRPGRTPKRRGR